MNLSTVELLNVVVLVLVFVVTGSFISAFCAEFLHETGDQKEKKMTVKILLRLIAVGNLFSLVTALLLLLFYFRH